jgi:hypothetical protein
MAQRRTVQAGRPYGALNKPKQFEISNNKSITELFSTQSESSQSAGGAPVSSTEAGSSTQTGDMDTEV